MSVGVGSVGRVSEVLKVDSLSHNLLSVVQSLDNGVVHSVVFTKTECKFLDANGAVLANANRQGNLYVYFTSCKRSLIATNYSSNTTPKHAIANGHQALS